MLRKTIPVLTHVDNLSDMKIDMSAQEQTLQNIDENTNSLQTSVGLPADAASSNTVIGLLKSIANKL